MTHTFSIGTISGSDLRVHWSWLALPGLVAVYSFVVFPWQEAAFFELLLGSCYLAVLLHEGTKLLAARRFGLRTRDVTLYPFWGVARFSRISDRPWQEIYIASTGPVLFSLLAVGVGALLASEGYPFGIVPEALEPTTASFLEHFFWILALLAGLHVLPFLPLDGGHVLRAYLSTRNSRLAATEVCAILSTFGAGLLLIAAIAWLDSLLVGVTGILLYFGAQQELGTTRFFAHIRHETDDLSRKPAMLVSLDQILTPECRPSEPDYSGFTWNEHARLWIEWREGQPVAANGLIGDGRP